MIAAGQKPVRKTSWKSGCNSSFSLSRLELRKVNKKNLRISFEVCNFVVELLPGHLQTRPCTRYPFSLLILLGPECFFICFSFFFLWVGNISSHSTLCHANMQFVLSGFRISPSVVSGYLFSSSRRRWVLLCRRMQILNTQSTHSKLKRPTVEREVKWVTVSIPCKKSYKRTLRYFKLLKNISDKVWVVHAFYFGVTAVCSLRK